MNGSQVATLIHRYRSQFTALVFWIVIGISVNVYMRANDLTVIEFADQIGHLLKDNWYGPLLYIGLYILRPITFFPATPLTVMAGYLYGVGGGMFYATVAGLCSMFLPYVAGRWFSDEDHLQQRLEQQDTRLSKLVRVMREHPFQTIFTTRMLYLPYDVVNFLAGSLHIKAMPFITATALGNIINGYAFLMVSIGASLDDLADGEFSLDPRLLILSLSIWLISLAINRFINSNKHKETISG